MEQGTIVKWVEDRGFGFIAPDFGGPEVYVSRWAFDPPADLAQGDRVMFKARKGDRGLHALRAAPVDHS